MNNPVQANQSLPKVPESKKERDSALRESGPKEKGLDNWDHLDRPNKEEAFRKTIMEVLRG